MDYSSEEFQRNRKSHKKRFIVVLAELLHSWKTPNSKKNVYETINVKHEYLEFLQYTDFRRDLKKYYPDVVASFGQKYGQIEVNGPACQVVDATVIINEQIHKICEKHLTLSQSKLVWNIVAKNRWNDYFATQLGKEDMIAKVCVGPSNALVILAFCQKECERAFEILFEIIREDTFGITQDFPIQSDQFQSLISKLQRGTLVQIEVLADDDENVVRIIGVKEDISQATQEISDFIKEDGIHSDTYRPQISQYIWDFLARRINHEGVKRIAKDLEQYSVSIQITDDHVHFLVHGFNKGIELCKQRLSELASMIVEQEKNLEYPGIERLFAGQAGKEQLKMIEKEMDVEIEIRIGKKFSKAPFPKPRAFSLPNKTLAESFIYDVCSFTTKEGIRVSWKYGSIENEAADVLVNSAHKNLNHPTACGRALMARGGSCFQEACKPHTAVRPGDIVVTESGNLLSKHVIHAVCRNLSRFREPSPAQEFLQGLVRKILEKCYELKASSLAMPMICAGQHGFPVEVVLQVIRNEINQLSSCKGDMHALKDIRIIVLQPKHERRKTAPLVTMPLTSPSSTSDQQERTDASSSTQIAFGHVRVYLCSDNETQYQADALVNLSSKIGNVSTKTSQSTHIQQSGDGIDFSNSMPKEAMKPPPGTVLVTKGGNGANVKYHMHTVPVSFDISGLERATKACLEAAKFFACNSVVISPTDITSLSISTNECANAILNATQIFSNANFTMDVRVVVLDINMMQIFKKAFEVKAEEQTTKAGFCESDELPVSKILSIGGKEEVILRVVGFHDSVNMSIEKIESYFNRSKVSKSINNKKMVNCFWKHNSEIRKFVKGREVFITLSTEEVSIEGIAEQVFECKDALTEFLRTIDEKEEELKRLREISESVQWSYSEGNGNVLFDEILNGMVENESRVGNKFITIPSKEDTYEVDLDKMIIHERHTGRTALLSRKCMKTYQVLPTSWEPQPKDEDVRIVALPSSSNEYQAVVNLFGSANDLVIVQKIERIQNPRLCKMYLCKKESMGTEANEKQLFHGTKSENVSSINTNNFNRRFSGINGTRFGHGVYFARDASYSVRYSLKDSEKENSVFHMYVAKVLVGMSVKGDKKMRVLPKRNDPRNPELFYDTAVDDTEDPSIFVTFDDHQCYPEYLITFKAS